MTAGLVASGDALDGFVAIGEPSMGSCLAESPDRNIIARNSTPLATDAMMRVRSDHSFRHHRSPMPSGATNTSAKIITTGRWYQGNPGGAVRIAGMYQIMDMQVRVRANERRGASLD